MFKVTIKILVWIKPFTSELFILFMCRLQANERIILHAIESVVIKWSHQIQQIVEKNSAQPLLSGVHLVPQNELDFWTMRRENLSCIYDQVSDPSNSWQVDLGWLVGFEWF